MDERQAFETLHRFDRVDEADDRAEFVRFLELIDSLPDVRIRRQRSYSLLGVQAGSRIVDVGCGIGTVLAELIELGADPVGVDVSEEMVAQARTRVPEATVVVGDAISLPLEAGSVDGYRAERVYQHLAEPDLALIEAARVLRPGGRVVLVDQDWDAVVVAADDQELTRAILQSFSDSLVDGRAGLLHRERLVAAGFVDVTVDPEVVAFERFSTLEPALIGTANAATPVVGSDAAQRWIHDLRRRDADGTFLVLMTHIVASATRR